MSHSTCLTHASDWLSPSMAVGCWRGDACLGMRVLQHPGNGASWRKSFILFVAAIAVGSALVSLAASHFHLLEAGRAGHFSATQRFVAKAGSLVKSSVQQKGLVVSTPSTQTAPQAASVGPQDTHYTERVQQADVKVESKYVGFYRSSPDLSPRCIESGICDHLIGVEPGPDGWGLITGAEERRAAVKQAASESWAAYKTHAWGHDELVADDGSRDWLYLQGTIVDSLDTLLVMGLEAEYQAALDKLHELDLYNLPHHEISVFETTIRIIGGLLSAYSLRSHLATLPGNHTGSHAKDIILLEKAVQLGEMLMPAFNTTFSLPSPMIAIPVDLAAMKGTKGAGNIVIAGAGTLSLEFSLLSRLTGRPEFEVAAMQFWQHLHHMGTAGGFFCESMDANTFGCLTPAFALGAPSDSFYEYMLKQWLISGKKDEALLDYYVNMAHGVRRHMMVKTRVRWSKQSEVAAKEASKRRAAQAQATANAGQQQQQQKQDGVAAGGQQGISKAKQAILQQLTAAAASHATSRSLMSVPTTPNPYYYMGSSLYAGAGGWPNITESLALAWMELRSRMGIASGGSHSSSSQAAEIGQEHQGEAASSLRQNTAHLQGQQQQAASQHCKQACHKAEDRNHGSTKQGQGSIQQATSITHAATASQKPGVITSQHRTTSSSSTQWESSRVHSSPRQQSRSRFSMSAWLGPTRRRALKAVFGPIMAVGRTLISVPRSWVPDRTRAQVASAVRRGRALLAHAVGTFDTPSLTRYHTVVSSSEPLPQEELWLLASLRTTGSGTPLHQPPDIEGLDPLMAVEKLPLGGRAGSEAAAQAAAEAMQRHKGIGVSYSMGMPNTKTQVQRVLHMQHLTCFAPGLFALGHTQGINTALGRSRQEAVAAAMGRLTTQRPAQVAGNAEAALHTAAFKAASETHKPNPNTASTATSSGTNLHTQQAARAHASSVSAAGAAGSKHKGGGSGFAGSVASLLEADRQQQLRRHQQQQQQQSGGGKSMGRRGSGIQTASDGGKSSSRQLRQGGRGLLQAEEQIIRREPVVAALQPEAATDTDLEVAIKLMRGCYEMYRMSPSGISADEAIFTYKYIAEPKPASHKQDNAGSGAASAKQGGISGDSVRVAHKVVTLPNDYSPRDMRAWLRPEVIESLYYLYHATHDQVYRDWGWQIFRALHLYARRPDGSYMSLSNAHSPQPGGGERMESFWLAETLKYLYLLFSDDARERLPWDKWVFNTEAHPLPVAGSFPDKAAMSAARQVDWAASAWSDLRKLYAQHRQ